MVLEEENLILLDERIGNLDLDSILNSNIIMAFDFDELIIKEHLTKKITTLTSKAIDFKKLDILGSCSFDGIKYLNSLNNGFSYLKFVEIRDEIIKNSFFSEGIDELIIDLCKKFSVIVISSGLKDIVEKKLEKINFNQSNIIGGELKINDNKIQGSNLIITDELKGYVINKIKEKEKKVISIGHSLGDKYMLENSNFSISYQGEKNIADFNLENINELRAKIFDLIENNFIKI